MSLNHLIRILGNWTFALVLLAVYLTVVMASIFGLAVVLLALPIWTTVSLVRPATNRDTSTSPVH